MYLLDTNIISELKKLDSGKIHPQVQRWAYSINLMQTKISVVSITEIRTGILSLARKDQAQAASLDNWFTTVCCLPTVPGHCLLIQKSRSYAHNYTSPLNGQ
jgi:PIN family toxin-antitoxin system, toxin component